MLTRVGFRVSLDHENLAKPFESCRERQVGQEVVSALGSHAPLGRSR